jgi:hypothetical protein
MHSLWLSSLITISISRLHLSPTARPCPIYKY